jgi:hypothetical protein
LLVDLFVEGGVLVVDDFLGLLVEILNLVFNAFLDVFVENSKNVVLFPDVHSDLFIVAFVLEEVPEL